jgi:hypothetical protein
VMTARARSSDPAIDEDAPVISSAETEIDAPIEAVCEGVVARILRRPLQKMLDKTLTDGVHHVKAEAEQSGRRPESGPTAGHVR